MMTSDLDLSLQDRITQLEMDLEEERNNGDLLMDRIEQGRKQASDAVTTKPHSWDGGVASVIVSQSP